MAHSYTPGLKVTPCYRVRKERLLPLPGEVRVAKGETVRADTVVAAAALPGQVTPVNVANKLGLSASEVPECMLKGAGDVVEAGELLARTKGLFGLFKSECKAPIAGTVTSISKVTGQVMLQGPPIPVEVRAYIDGEVVEVLPGEGAILETWAMFVQGIFGIGGETDGILEMVVESPEDVLDETRIPPDARGRVLVGGSLVTYGAIQKAREAGAAALVAGGLHDADLRKLLGRDLGVAITGNEELGTTVVVTEGFGTIRMADKTFQLLRDKNGRMASVNGATQIRAGVLRPEIVVPLTPDEIPKDRTTQDAKDPGLQEGDVVRIIREPSFGRLGRVVQLPAPLRKLESESMARVLVLEFENGEQRTVARSNIEAIEEV